jgi:hypothetical protein
MATVTAAGAIITSVPASSGSDPTSGAVITGAMLVSSDSAGSVAFTAIDGAAIGISVAEGDPRMTPSVPWARELSGGRLSVCEA